MKEKQYRTVLQQVRAITEGETDIIANMANTTAILYDAFGFWWVGFYRVQDDELVLGPFQGPVACTRIRKGKGVCGTSWERKQTVIVPDVNKFPGHIACSAVSKSEIVVPVLSNGEVIAVLDIDSKDINSFDETDKVYLERIISLIAMADALS